MRTLEILLMITALTGSFALLVVPFMLLPGVGSNWFWR